MVISIINYRDWFVKYSSLTWVYGESFQTLSVMGWQWRRSLWKYSPYIQVSDGFCYKPEPSSIENDAHGIEKLMLKTQNSSKLNKFLHSEVNLLIQHIVVQDQEGENNNKQTNSYNL